MGDKRRGQNFICKNHHILEIIEIPGETRINAIYGKLKNYIIWLSTQKTLAFVSH